jgi:hypothetical protein
LATAQLYPFREWVHLNGPAMSLVSSHLFEKLQASLVMMRYLPQKGAKGATAGGTDGNPVNKTDMNCEIHAKYTKGLND